MDDLLQKQILESFSRKMDEANKILAEKTAQLRKENEEWSRQFDIVMGYQNDGMVYEKQKEYDKAAECYERAIQAAKSLDKMHGRAEHSAERLAVIYRRMKLYDKEIEAIHYAIECAQMRNDTTRLYKYEDRLSKATILYNKTL